MSCRLLIAIFFLATVWVGTCVNLKEDESFVEASRQRHCPNPPKKRYELLRAFTQYMTQHPHLRWSLGFGSLLGAMRQDPPGFIQGDDDLDLYMPARDLAELRDTIKRDENNNVSSLGLLKEGYDWNGIDGSCCSFGWRISHRHDECAYMDFFALSFQKKSVKGHDQGAWQMLGGAHITQDGRRDDSKAHKYGCPDALMEEKGYWGVGDLSLIGSGAHEWSWTGKDECFWSSFYVHGGAFLLEDQLFPLQQKLMYDLSVNVPKDPWPLLNRFYGKGVANHDDHGHDLNKDPKWRKPADVGIIVNHDGHGHDFNKDPKWRKPANVGIMRRSIMLPD